MSSTSVHSSIKAAWVLRSNCISSWLERKKMDPFFLSKSKLAGDAQWGGFLFGGVFLFPQPSVFRRYLRKTIGRVFLPQRLINQSLYQEIPLLKKFNDIGGNVLKPKQISLQTSKGLIYSSFPLCYRFYNSKNI